MMLLLVSDAQPCGTVNGGVALFSVLSYCLFLYIPACLIWLYVFMNGGSLRILGVSYGISTLLCFIFLLFDSSYLGYMPVAAIFIYWFICACVKTFMNHANEAISNYREGEGYLDTADDSDDIDDDTEAPVAKVE